MITSPIETLTNAIPTEGATPRDSLTAQTTSCASLCPKIEDTPVLRDLLPEDVPSLDGGRVVGGLEVFVTEGE